MGCQFEIVREELKPAVVLIVEPLHQTVGEGGIAFFSDVLLELNLVVAPRFTLASGLFRRKRRLGCFFEARDKMGAAQGHPLEETIVVVASVHHDEGKLGQLFNGALGHLDVGLLGVGHIHDDGQKGVVTDDGV